MDRRTFVARSLPAMLLALLGLRLPNALSLSPYWYVVGPTRPDGTRVAHLTIDGEHRVVILIGPRRGDHEKLRLVVLDHQRWVPL